LAVTLLSVVSGGLDAWADGAAFRAPVNSGAWRGRTMSRRGLFNVDRAHWGSGLTPAGQSVLVSGIQTFGQVAPVIFGGPATGGGQETGTGLVDELERGALEQRAEELQAIVAGEAESVRRLRQMQRDLCGLFRSPPEACQNPEQPRVEGEPAAPAIPGVQLPGSPGAANELPVPQPTPDSLP
jgi:hypothetical protein